MKYILIFFALAVTNSAVYSQIMFEETAVDLGINKGYGEGFFGGGISFFDFNNDGWDDITMATSLGDSVYFFKNNLGEFEQILPSLITNTSEINQVLWIDFDNDGDNDLFITAHNSVNKLYRNDGDLSMTDVSAEAGISEIVVESEGAAWGDYNNDGFLDLYVTNYNDVSVSISNVLYRNNGDGTFTNVSELANVTDTGKYPFQPLFTDFNNDGNQDIYIAMDRQDGNTVLKNAGNGLFADITADCGGGLSMWAMTITPGDFDNDGDDDYYFSNLPGHGSKLVKNLGDSQFTEVSEIANVNWQNLGWGAVFLDADLDGDIDLYQSGGHTGINGTESNVFYENKGDGTFTEAAVESFGLDSVESFSNAIGDINNDGLPDIVVNNGAGYNVSVWQNTSNTAYHYLKVKPEGVISNKNGIGSRIYTYISGVYQMRYIYYGNGYLAQNMGYALFGLGQAEMVDSVVVEWLSGVRDVVYNIDSDQMITVIEGEGLVDMSEIQADHIKVFPNPCNDYIIIKFEAAARMIRAISIWNLQGVMIKTIDVNSLSENLIVDTSTLPSGVYVIQFRIAHRTFSKKLNIIH